MDQPSWCCSCFFKPVNSLTSVKFLNWVCSRFLAVAFSSFPSASEEFLKIRAAVAMDFSRSEPFPRAVGEEPVTQPRLEMIFPQTWDYILHGTRGRGLGSVCQPGPALGPFVSFWEGMGGIRTWTFKRWRTKILSEQ